MEIENVGAWQAEIYGGPPSSNEMAARIRLAQAGERQMARELFDESEFVEVFIDTPLKTREKRDPKGLYRKARCADLSPEEAVGRLLDELRRLGVL